MNKTKTIDMKTVVTVTKTHQIGMEEYADEKTSKVFDDDATLGEIKDWIIQEQKLKVKRESLGISGTSFSNLID